MDKKDKGFTLIELLVALGIFMVVMTVATAIFTGVVRANRHAQAKQHALLSLSIALETMQRTIQFGYDYTSDQSGNYDIQLKDFQGNAVEFLCSNCAAGGPAGSITRTFEGTTVDLVSNEFIDIDNFEIAITGAGASDGEQSYVRITVGGTVDIGARSTGVRQRFNMQTTATQLLIDG